MRMNEKHDSITAASPSRPLPPLLAQSQCGTDREVHSKHTCGSVPSPFFKQGQWTPDGTCIITTSSDKQICTYVIPPDLLQDRQQPLELVPYCRTEVAEAVDAVAVFPYFDLQNPSTNLLLAATNDHPVRLHSAADGSLLASYPLVNPTTEAYIKPHSLLFVQNGTSFIAGSENLISTFDLSQPGQEPKSSLQTGPKRLGSSANPSTSLRGLITALDVERHSNVLAAGTYSREVALYDTAGQGECLGVFSVRGTQADSSIRGAGITQVIWSPCGRYLYIVERKSDGVMFYDIRKTGQLLGWMTGRRASTNQRMKVDLITDTTNNSEQLWGGGTDGMVRMWQDPHLNEGPVEPVKQLLLHDDVVNNVTMHRTAKVLASTSGNRHYDGERWSSLLKLWHL